jgi:hypothetical protein
MKRMIIVLLGVLCIAACGKLEESKETTVTLADPAEIERVQYAPAMEKPMNNEESISEVAPPTLELKMPAKIIKNAEVRMQVDRLDPGYTKVKAIVAKYNAYFGSDNRSQSDNEITQNMNIRVPAVKFDSILEELVKEGIYINYKNVSAEDVTDEFVDVEARLKTKKEVELRYLDLLKDAKKVSEILEVENNLRTIREEIESFEGRMKHLKDQIAYSDINLAMYQTLEYKAKPKVSFGSQVVESLADGWTNLRGFTLNVIAAWPFLIPILLISIAIKKWRSRKK